MFEKDIICICVWWYIWFSRGKVEKKVWWWLGLLWLENVYIGLMEMARKIAEKKKWCKNQGWWWSSWSAFEFRLVMTQSILSMTSVAAGFITQKNKMSCLTGWKSFWETTKLTKHEKGQDEEGIVVRGILNMKAETQFNQKMRLRLLQFSETVVYLLPLQVLLQRREVDGGRRRWDVEVRVEREMGSMDRSIDRSKKNHESPGEKATGEGATWLGQKWQLFSGDTGRLKS